jgi:hypothetical protein
VRPTDLDRRNGLAAIALLHADVDLVALGAAEGKRVVRGAADAANVNVRRAHGGKQQQMRVFVGGLERAEVETLKEKTGCRLRRKK